jgi:hypothetical protein
VITLALALGVSALVSARIATLVARSRRQTHEPTRKAPPSPPRETDSAARGTCEVGDVVVLPTGETAWLAGALTFHETAPRGQSDKSSDRTVSALFVAPERGRDRAVYVSADKRVHWLTITTGLPHVGKEPLSALEHEGERFLRTRRLPVAVDRSGENAPDVGDEAIVGEYAGDGDASLVVVVGARATLAWSGRRLADGAYEVWPAGDEPS